MLVLPIQTRGNVIAVADDAAAGRFCVALARPRVARRPDGGSRARLIRWTTTEPGAVQPVGGRLTLDIEVEPTREELAAAGFAPDATSPMPWLQARLRLDGPEFDAVEAEVSTALGTSAAVAVDLSPEAAAVLAPLLSGDSVSPLQVTWTGDILVRLPPVEVTATADVTEVRRRVDLVRPGQRKTITRSVIDANARIEIRGADNAALEEALRNWVLDELTTRFSRGETMSIHAAASEVVRWPVHLATTLDDLIPPASRGGIVETIILPPGEIRPVPPIEVRVLGPFSGALERVDVRLTPLGVAVPVELSFSDDAPQSASLGTRDFRWSYRVKRDNRPAGSWSAWQEVRGSTAVLVPVSLPAALSIEVLAAALDFTVRWASVRVVLTHTPPDGAPASHIIELTAQHPSGTWTQPLDGPRGVVRAQLTYISRHGQTVERVIEELSGNQIIVRDPLEGNRVRVALVPGGTGWGEIAVAMVDLRYTDGPYTVTEAVELTKVDDFAEREIPARPDGPRTIEWRLHASYANGRFESTAWQTATPGVIVVPVQGQPRREVQVLPIYFDKTLARDCTLRLRSGAHVETVTITDRTQRTVTLGPGPFSWTVQWTAADGASLPESPARDGEDVIVVPRFTRG
jgi:hypothetical protein